MPRDYYPIHFPNLIKLGVTETSRPAASYNCIAFVIGETHRNWWPGDYPPKGKDYWPQGIRNDETLEAFEECFHLYDFRRCANGRLESGYQKIALYAHNGEVTHAAIQKETGMWSSKLGRDEDIEHTLEGLEGPFYGTVVAFFKRPSHDTPSRMGCLTSLIKLIIDR